MPQIKAILSDFDGTLVDHDEKLDPSTKKLVKKLKDNGIRFSIATGRAYYGSSVKKVESELGIHGFHIFHGGGLILNTNDMSIHWQQAISQASLKFLIKYFRKSKTFFILEAIDSFYLSNVKDIPSMYPKNVPTKSVEDIPNNAQILKLLVSAYVNKLDEETIKIHQKNILEICKDVEPTKFKRLEHFGMDVTSEKATKHTAALEYAKIVGIKPEEMVGIGNSYNDYPLLTACGIKIVMDDGPKELKEIADLIVPRTENGGMRMALEYILKKV